ncbi:hypothetical protein [Glutamicibacter sp. V16R2B1]|uniref:hypothetical protein n=1 Tax=Glutamicibacter sp. V16R2B1 TaxID=2036207 RepID=UPI0010FE6B7E|nr:hypothetical protein [Glutamicibacter sp. V16R2B1]MCK9901266.1 hypothetical protein [Frankia sp. Cpl3]TLK46299.1 hypothetical protein FDN03_16280 [Glutamicibacter sp. V16R2B1]
MTPRLHGPDEIRKLPTTNAKARAVREYFLAEKEMRAIRDEVIRALRADKVSIADTATEVACSIATVKTAARGMDSSQPSSTTLES